MDERSCSKHELRPQKPELLQNVEMEKLRLRRRSSISDASSTSRGSRRSIASSTSRGSRRSIASATPNRSRAIWSRNRTADNQEAPLTGASDHKESSLTAAAVCRSPMYRRERRRRLTETDLPSLKKLANEADPPAELLEPPPLEPLSAERKKKRSTSETRRRNISHPNTGRAPMTLQVALRLDPLKRLAATTTSTATTAESTKPEDHKDPLSQNSSPRSGATRSTHTAATAMASEDHKEPQSKDSTSISKHSSSRRRANRSTQSNTAHSTGSCETVNPEDPKSSSPIQKLGSRGCSNRSSHKKSRSLSESTKSRHKRGSPRKSDRSKCSDNSIAGTTSTTSSKRRRKKISAAPAGAQLASPLAKVRQDYDTRSTSSAITSRSPASSGGVGNRALLDAAADLFRRQALPQSNLEHHQTINTAMASTLPLPRLERRTSAPTQHREFVRCQGLQKSMSEQILTSRPDQMIDKSKRPMPTPPIGPRPTAPTVLQNGCILEHKDSGGRRRGMRRTQSVMVRSISLPYLSKNRPASLAIADHRVSLLMPSPSTEDQGAYQLLARCKSCRSLSTQKHATKQQKPRSCDPRPVKDSGKFPHEEDRQEDVGNAAEQLIQAATVMSDLVNMLLEITKATDSSHTSIDKSTDTTHDDRESSTFGGDGSSTIHDEDSLVSQSNPRRQRSKSVAACPISSSSPYPGHNRRATTSTPLRTNQKDEISFSLIADNPGGLSLSARSQGTGVKCETACQPPANCDDDESQQRQSSPVAAGNILIESMHGARSRWET